jgi:hypothetical protein
VSAAEGYTEAMVNVVISLPDEVAARAERLAADRGVSVGELASEVVEAYVGRPNGEPTLSFIGIGTAADGFSAREAEQQLEANGFQPSA